MKQQDLPFDGDDLEQVTIRALVMDPVTSVPVVVLGKKDEGRRLLPIWIGLCEANAIALAMEGVTTPRPMTHDLLASVLGATGKRLDRVVIHSLEHNVFHATLVLAGDSPERALTVDSRPSDAIALAIRAGAPLFVTRTLLEHAAFEESSETELLRAVLEKIPVEKLGNWEM